MDIKKLKKEIYFLRLIIFIIFAILIFFTIYKKPEVPEKVKKNFKIVEFKTFGGNLAEYGWNALNTNDGYLIVGDTASFSVGKKDIYLLRVNENGELLWSRTYGGKGEESGLDIIPAKGGYLIVGMTTSKGYGESDVYVLKINYEGDVIWEKTYGGYNYDCAYSIVKSDKDTYMIVGYTSSVSEINSDLYILKINENGKLLWEKTYGGYGWDIGYSIIRTKDNNYAITGYTDSFGSGKTDIYFLEVDSKGNCLLAKTYGGIRDDKGISLIETDNGFLIAGNSSSYVSRGFGMDMLILKINKKGKIITQKVFPAAEFDVGKSVVKTENGFLFAGVKKCYGICNSNVYVLSLNKNLDLLWYKIFAGKSNDRATSIIKTDENNFLITGMTLSYGNGNGDVFLLKIDKNGDVVF